MQKLGSTEAILLHLMSRIEAARHRALTRHQRSASSLHTKRGTNINGRSAGLSLFREYRTIEFWRSVLAECVASFLYTFLLCATHLTWSGSSYVFGPSPNWIVIALTSGFTMATLVQCFGHISGGHVNPVVTLIFALTKKISPLRALFYIVAHCCGAIAGAALLYG